MSFANLTVAKKLIMAARAHWFEGNEAEKPAANSKETA